MKGIVKNYITPAITALSLLLLSAQAGCLPGSTSILIGKITNCREGDQAITEGLLDVQVAESYTMKLSLINMLAVSASSAEFKSEANFIDVKEIKIWFEVANKNIKIPLDPNYFPTKSNPRVLKVFLPLPPSISADFAGLSTGGTTSTSLPQGEDIQFQLIPTNMINAWRKIIPNILKSQGLQRMAIIAHIQFMGQTRAGITITSQEVTFPIYICDNCLNNSDPKNPSLACQYPTNSGLCIGQDGICKETSPEGGGDNPPPTP